MLLYYNISNTFFFYVLWHENHGPHLDIEEIIVYGKILENHEDFIGKTPDMGSKILLGLFEERGLTCIERRIKKSGILMDLF